METLKLMKKLEELELQALPGRENPNKEQITKIETRLKELGKMDNSGGYINLTPKEEHCLNSLY